MKLKLFILILPILFAASCNREVLPEPEEKGGEIVTINATIPSETRVAYDDGTLKLSWEDNDQLLLAGFDGTTYKGSSTFTYTGTGNSFSGTTVPGATTYKAYYPSTVTIDADGNVQLPGNFWQQTQSGDNSTAHLNSKLFLSDEAANPLTERFALVMKNSIIKYVLSNIPEGVGALSKLVWTVETDAGGLTRWGTLNMSGVTFSSSVNSLTAFFAFDPNVMKIVAGGKVKITLIGDQSYQWSTTVTNKKDYSAGNRYNATVSGIWVLASTSLRYTITTTASGTTYNIKQKEALPSPANLTINWGDGNETTIAKNASLSNIIDSHVYATPGNYTITITSDQADPTQKQIPQIIFNGNSSASNGDKFLTAILDPFPFMGTSAGATNFSYYFNGCTGLSSIPEGLFSNNEQITNFSYSFQGCTGLTSIPKDLFKYQKNVSTFQSCFWGCTGLTKIPPELFSHNTMVKSFTACFRVCTGLTSIPNGLFSNNPIVLQFNECFMGCTGLTGNIPAGMFSNNTEVTTFASCFSGCTGLTGSIPAGMFSNNTKVENFSSCFNNCSGLTGTTPTDLFRYNTVATNFYYCFRNCTRLQLTQDIFPSPATNIDFFVGRGGMNFTKFFENVGSFAGTPAGTAPALWEFNTGGAAWTFADCFKNANVTNYGLIPNNWKGL